MSDQPVLDRTRLNLICAGSPELARTLVDTFLGEAQPILEDLRASIAAGTGDSIREKAHSIKGMASNIGAQRAYEAALELERAGRDGAPQDQLKLACRRVAAALEEVKGERDAGL